MDSYVVYRRLVPNKSRSHIRGIYQRDLESFRSSPLITTRDGAIHCFNCHTFHQHDPNRFLLHVRGEFTGMVLVTDGEIRRIDTKQAPMFRPLAYASWHPDGLHIAATCNRFIGNTPANARTYYFEALEKRGDLLVYNVEKNTLSTSEAVFGHEFIETHPCWSPDGKYIYYCRARDLPIVTPEDWEANDFDLMRVAYDVETDTWGEPETVKAYSELGVSCAFPRPSPCGRYILPRPLRQDVVSHPSGERRSLLAGPGDRRRQEARRCLQQSGRELSPVVLERSLVHLFEQSRRRDERLALSRPLRRAGGNVSKPFVVPQEDPDYYDTFIDTYNTLEPVKSRVNIDTFKLAQSRSRTGNRSGVSQSPRSGCVHGADPGRCTDLLIPAFRFPDARRRWRSHKNGLASTGSMDARPLKTSAVRFQPMTLTGSSRPRRRPKSPERPTRRVARGPCSSGDSPSVQGHSRRRRCRPHRSFPK